MYLQQGAFMRPAACKLAHIGLPVAAWPQACNRASRKPPFVARPLLPGPLNDIKIITDKTTGRSKGFAYVEFQRKEDVLNALGLTGQVRMQAGRKCMAGAAGCPWCAWLVWAAGCPCRTVGAQG